MADGRWQMADVEPAIIHGAIAMDDVAEIEVASAVFHLPSDV
jgi:hypothetical protein